MSRPAVPLMNRLSGACFVNGKTGCHEWTGQLDRGGYGKISIPGRGTQKVHRVAYEMLVGEIPTGVLVLHHCDNPKCFNPAHLYLGTHKDNTRDRIKRGRHWGRRLLSDEQVLWIIEQLRTDRSQQSIADEIGISQITVSRIKLGQRDYLTAILNRSRNRKES